METSHTKVSQSVKQNNYLGGIKILSVCTCTRSVSVIPVPLYCVSVHPSMIKSDGVKVPGQVKLCIIANERTFQTLKEQCLTVLVTVLSYVMQHYLILTHSEGNN